MSAAMQWKATLSHSLVLSHSHGLKNSDPDKEESHTIIQQ